MKFKANIPDEMKEYLSKEYNDYVQKTPMTPDERKAVREWVSMGNSVYENSFMMCDEYGKPEEYLVEYRMEKDIERATRNMSEEDALRYRLSCYGYDYDQHFNKNRDGIETKS